MPADIPNKLYFTTIHFQKAYLQFFWDRAEDFGKLNRNRLFPKSQSAFILSWLSPLLANTAIVAQDSRTSLSSAYRRGLSIRMAQSALFLQCKETSSLDTSPHRTSPQVFPNSTPLDVWEAQLVVDHKALNHCLLIKHSTQWMRTGSPSPECQQWLQMRPSGLCWSISLQADIMALCLLERTATSLDSIPQVSFQIS